VSLFEQHSLEHQEEYAPGWLPLALHQGSVPFDAIFSAFDILFRARVRVFL
jgi:hypothetical protein